MADTDWARLDFDAIRRDRLARLSRLRSTPGALAAVKQFYRQDPASFIIDWGHFQEPRNAAAGLPTTIPAVLWPRQRELIGWILERWRSGQNGVVAKSRDTGCTWITTALACTLCLFNPGMVIGLASRKVEYCDGTPKSLLAKARFFLRELPPEFLGGLDLDRHAPFMRIVFPDTGSAITAEGGSQIGRGDRTSLTMIDEAAFLEDPQAVDAALSQTTRTRIDVSTPHGRDNPFAAKFFSGKTPTFVFSWRDCPIKDQKWYDHQVATLPPHILAQEVNCDFNASIENVLIPRIWVEAAIDAHRKLDVPITGRKFAGFDIADTGDRCALCLRRGILISHLESWSGVGSDLYASTVRAINILDHHGWESFDFDNDGLGASVTGDAARINEQRAMANLRVIRAESFRGSGAVYNPDSELIPGRKNADFFLNAKAQSWWWLRQKFQMTFRAVVQGVRPFDVESLISIDPKLPELGELLAELSWPTFSTNQTGKITIDKHAGGRSPDRADALMIAFNPAGSAMAIWEKLGRRSIADGSAMLREMGVY